MIRTQIQLTEQQAEALKRLAARRGTSMAAVVREAVERTVGEDDLEARHRRALSVAGRFRSGRHDIGEEHDRYLAEALEQ